MMTVVIQQSQKFLSKNVCKISAIALWETHTTNNDIAFEKPADWEEPRMSSSVCPLAAHPEPRW